MTIKVKIYIWHNENYCQLRFCHENTFLFALEREEFKSCDKGPIGLLNLNFWLFQNSGEPVGMLHLAKYSQIGAVKQVCRGGRLCYLMQHKQTKIKMINPARHKSVVCP